jgi:predicted nucleic acid-binding protein
MLAGVLDANIVIGLAKGGVFDHLAAIYAPLYIPSAVTQEVIGQGQGRAGVQELTQALGGWVIEITPDPQRVQTFAASLRSVADRQVLAVAQEQRVDHVLTTDGRLIQEARRYGLTCLDAPELLVLLKRRGLIPAVRVVLDQMRQQGFGITNAVYHDTLRAAGE